MSTKDESLELTHVGMSTKDKKIRYKRESGWNQRLATDISSTQTPAVNSREAQNCNAQEIKLKLLQK